MECLGASLSLILAGLQVDPTSSPAALGWERQSPKRDSYQSCVFSHRDVLPPEIICHISVSCKPSFTVAAAFGARSAGAWIAGDLSQAQRSTGDLVKC